MVRGAFASFVHVHEFRDDGEGGTLMIDDVEYRSPLGPLGILADKLFLARYLTRFLRERAEYLRSAAEAKVVRTAR